MRSLLVNCPAGQIGAPFPSGEDAQQRALLRQTKLGTMKRPGIGKARDLRVRAFVNVPWSGCWRVERQSDHVMSSAA
jgi:hypothetical protein